MSNKLYHSDIYLGQDFSDGLKHYKYLRKVKTSYGWRYIYDESELKRNEAISKDVEKQARSSDGYEYIDKDGFSIDRGEYVYNWDDSEYCREREEEEEEERRRQEDEDDDW